MPPSKITSYHDVAAPQSSVLKESHLEQGFIGKLLDLKYTHRPDIRDRAALERNFREKFEALNRCRLTDSEFARLLDEIVTPDVFAAAKKLREMNAFTRDDGTPLNYTLVNIKDWCKNDFEVVQQLRINTDNSHHRYDVVLLINGIPCVQIELKTLEINPRRAMEQIVEYKNDPGNGYTRTLLCFLQLFIVSNRNSTWYFANNNAGHFAFNAEERFLPIYQFADEANKKIVHLDDFADKFLHKCTLGQAISKYMVLIASEQKLMMMRPYQVYAVKQIKKCIDDDAGNGYIWHTTGSGKTLTSFKASTLLKLDDDIHKCLFVVDRKDLDRQTREEFNKFQEGCVEENTNTAALVRAFAASDKPLNQTTHSNSDERPDIVAFAEVDEDKVARAVSILEFKKQQRTNFDEDPTHQLYRYLRKIKENKKVRLPNGRDLNVGETTRHCCYAICDITRAIHEYAENNGNYARPKGELGYYMNNRALNAHTEILHFDKTAVDTKRRNKAIFEKLGIG